MDELKPCCRDCDNLRYESPCPDQPYPEIWCGAGRFDSPSSFEELEEPIDCVDFKARNQDGGDGE